MPIQVRWLDETRKILLTEFVGAYTREENQQSQEERKLLYADTSYPIGVIENESQGYIVQRSNTHQIRAAGRHSYSSSTDFSVQNPLQNNRIAVTIKIPYALDTWETPEDGDLWNAHSREKLQRVFEYPTLASVTVMMTVIIDEAQQIILDYLTKLEASKRETAAV